METRVCDGDKSVTETSVCVSTLTFQLHSHTETLLKPTVRTPLALTFVNLAAAIVHT